MYQLLMTVALWMMLLCVTVGSSSMDEERSDRAVAVGIPVQGSAIGDVDPKQPAPTDTYQHLPAPTNSNQQGEPTGRAMGTNGKSNQQGPTGSNQREPTVNVIQPKRACIAKPIVAVESRARARPPKNITNPNQSKR